MEASTSDAASTSRHVAQDSVELAASEGVESGEAQELPFPAPLSHSLFLAEPFDASSFLLTRKHVGLDDLRSELRAHLASLRMELVAIINSDYEDFINLGGSHLNGSEDQMSFRMRKPLEGISREIYDARDEVSAIKQGLMARLAKRDEIRARKAVCRKLLAVNEQVHKVEEMLLIPSPVIREGHQADAEGLKTVSAHSAHRRASHPRKTVDRSMGSDMKRIERIAQEYNQLLYLVRKSEGLTYVESLKPRIERITTTLLQDLASLLSSTITSLHSRPATASVKDIQASIKTSSEALTDLFRTYASIGKYREAEEVIRKELVSDFVARTVHREALLSPQSPMMPATPFASLTGALTASLDGATPGSSAPQSFPFNAVTTSSSLLEDRAAIPPFYHLDPIVLPNPTYTSDTSIADALVELYNKLLVFISKDLSLILEVAERRPAQGQGRELSLFASTMSRDGDATLPGSPTTKDRMRMGDRPVFEILSNVVWEEISNRLMNELSHLVFSAGRPDTFHRNYLASIQFIERIESLCPNQRHLTILRNNPNFTAFMRRWQLPVYFQLRFKEIVGHLENVLVVKTIIAAPTAVQSTPLLMSSSEAVYNAIKSTWSENIYLPELSGRCWRLTLQLLARFKTWLEANLPDHVVSAAQTAATAAGQTDAPSGLNLQRLLPSNPLTSSRPTTPGGSTAEDQSEDALLKQLSIIISDVFTMRDLVLRFFKETIEAKLPKVSTNIFQDDSEEANPEAALTEQLTSLTSITPSLLAQMIGILSKRCSEPLRLVRSGASQVKTGAKGKSSTPSEPSYFVPNILRPARVFLEGPGKVLRQEYKDALIAALFEDISSRYEAALSKMKESGDALRRLKKNRGGFQLFGRSSTTDDTNISEDEKVRQQMSVDVEAYAKDAESLGVQLDKSESLRALRKVMEQWSQ